MKQNHNKGSNLNVKDKDTDRHKKTNVLDTHIKSEKNKAKLKEELQDKEYK